MAPRILHLSPLVLALAIATLYQAEASNSPFYPTHGCFNDQKKKWCKINAECFGDPLRQRLILNYCRKFLGMCDAPLCAPGHMLNKHKHCVDINECSDPYLNDCGHGAKCINKPGSYTCECPADKPHGHPRARCYSGDHVCKTSRHGCPTGSKCVEVGDSHRCDCGSNKVERVDHQGKRHCDVKTECSVFGDPHFGQFDGQQVHFQGVCTYTLVSTACPKNVHPLPKGVEPFTINVKNKYVGNNRAVSYLDYVEIIMGKERVRLYGSGTIHVNGQHSSAPHYNTRAGYYILPDGRSRIFYARLGLRVIINPLYQAIVHLSTQYKNHLCGICGNNDGHGHNDLMLKSGQLTHSHVTFVNSWLVNTDHSSCGPAKPPPGCDKHWINKFRMHCNALKGKPFSTCHQHVNPHAFIEDCVYDLCALSLDSNSPKDYMQATLCDLYKDYADECVLKGHVVNWDKNKLCANYPKCPANSQYKHSITETPTCADPKLKRSKPSRAVGGCQCNPGYVEEDSGEKQCVRPHECGCTYKGYYYKLHQTWVNDLCSMKFSCVRPKGIIRWPIECGKHECRPGPKPYSGCYCKGSKDAVCDVPMNDPSTTPDDNDYGDECQ